MTRIKTIQRVDGIPYYGKTTIYQLWDGTGFGFDYCPLEGVVIKCKVLEDNKVVDRKTGKVIGEYEQMWKHVVFTI